MEIASPFTQGCGSWLIGMSKELCKAWANVRRWAGVAEDGGGEGEQRNAHGHIGVASPMGRQPSNNF